ncbi:MAG: hypothetical protein HZA89_08630 [Verrucomicrobia bacterium]|nr:hypothetical protein [Verrucomicrobiota bacterium]
MSHLPQVIVTDLITEPLDCERRVLVGHAGVRAFSALSQADLNANSVQPGELNEPASRRHKL